MDVPEDYRKEIVYVWGQHYQQITKTLLSQTISTNSLVDVDWSFGVTSASEACDQVTFRYVHHKTSHSFSICYLSSVFQLYL